VGKTILTLRNKEHIIGFSCIRQKQRKEEYIWKVFNREPEELRTGKMEQMEDGLGASCVR